MSRISILMNENLLIITQLFSCGNYFLAIIVTTLCANMMRHLRLVALWALYIARNFQLPVGTTGITTSLGHLTLRYCHFRIHLLKRFRKSNYFFNNNCCNVKNHGCRARRTFLRSLFITFRTDGSIHRHSTQKHSHM